MQHDPAPAEFPADTRNQVAERASARDLDKFYTKPEVARQCLDHFEAWTGISLETAGEDIIEPSAGAGAFLNLLPPRTLGVDIDPEYPLVQRANYLDLVRTMPAVVIGNPPFGKAARLAVKFFNHSAGFASHIGFILPRTFEKSSVQNRLDRRFHLLGQAVLTPESFTFENLDYAVPCVFQVWERRGYLRRLIDGPRIHPDFSFVARDQAHFAFQRVGVRAGKIKIDFDHVAAASHHFIRANDDLDQVLDTFRQLDFAEAKARTAGNPSISKTEIVDSTSDTADERGAAARQELRDAREGVLRDVSQSSRGGDRTLIRFRRACGPY